MECKNNDTGHRLKSRDLFQTRATHTKTGETEITIREKHSGVFEKKNPDKRRRERSDTVSESNNDTGFENVKKRRNSRDEARKKKERKRISNRFEIRRVRWTSGNEKKGHTQRQASADDTSATTRDHRFHLKKKKDLEDRGASPRRQRTKPMANHETRRTSIGPTRTRNVERKSAAPNNNDTKKKRNGLFGQRRPSQRGRFFARRSRSRLGVGGVGVGRLEAAPRAPASLAVGRREARRARQEERLVEGVAGVGALAHQQHRAQRPLRRRLGKVEHLGVPNKKKPTINPTVTRV